MSLRSIAIVGLVAAATVAYADPRESEIAALARGFVERIHVGPMPPALRQYGCYGFEMPKIPAFKKAYSRILSEIPKKILARDDGGWLRLKGATSHPNHFISTPAGSFVVVGACEPHNCPRRIIVLFQPETGRIGALIHGSDDKSEDLDLGEPSNEMAGLLRAVYALDEGDRGDKPNSREVEASLNEVRDYRRAR